MPRSRSKKVKKSTFKRVLILCEGKCEVNYLNGIRVDDDYKRNFTGVNVNIYQPQDFSPLGLVKEALEEKKSAKREKNPYDTVWVCFDHDGHANITEALQLAHQKNIKAIFSNICFEYWVLLHFQDTTKLFRKCNEIIRHIKANHNSNYEKTDNNFKVLKDSTDIAIKRAKKNRRNIPPGQNKLTYSAYTDVDKLVEYLFDLGN